MLGGCLSNVCVCRLLHVEQCSRIANKIMLNLLPICCFAQSLLSGSQAAAIPAVTHHLEAACVFFASGLMLPEKIYYGAVCGHHCEIAAALQATLQQVGSAAQVIPSYVQHHISTVSCDVVVCQLGRIDGAQSAAFGSACQSCVCVTTGHMAGTYDSREQLVDPPRAWAVYCSLPWLLCLGAHAPVCQPGTIQWDAGST